jgi:diamine N-acetyltransferase
MLSLREITRDNLQDILRLSVLPHQQAFVASNAVSIAQAHFYPEIAWFRAIYADDTSVGFVMLADEPEVPKYTLWRLMIDHRYQRQGHGRAALQLLCEHVRTRPGASALLTSCVPAQGGPGPFYERLGFAYTGELDDGEQVMRLAL